MHNLKELIREVLLTNSIKPDCGCGCKGTAKCFEAPMLNENLKARIVMTENLQYHIDAKKPLFETTLWHLWGLEFSSCGLQCRSGKCESCHQTIWWKNYLLGGSPIFTPRDTRICSEFHRSGVFDHLSRRT